MPAAEPIARDVPKTAAGSALRRLARFLASPPGATTILLVAGFYWGALYLHSRAASFAENCTPGTPDSITGDSFALDRSSDGWRIRPADPLSPASYTVSDLSPPARLTWLAAPIRRSREVALTWSPLADTPARTGAPAAAPRSSGSETERRQALAALAAWLESPTGANAPNAATFLRAHPDGRSSETLPSGYVHTGILAALSAAFLFSLAHSPLWMTRSARALRLRSARAHNRCPACGYPADGLTAATCPECGDHDTTRHDTTRHDTTTRVPAVV